MNLELRYAKTKMFISRTGEYTISTLDLKGK